MEDCIKWVRGSLPDHRSNKPNNGTNASSWADSDTSLRRAWLLDHAYPPSPRSCPPDTRFRYHTLGGTRRSTARITDLTSRRAIVATISGRLRNAQRKNAVRVPLEQTPQFLVISTRVPILMHLSSTPAGIVCSSFYSGVVSWRRGATNRFWN